MKETSLRLHTEGNGIFKENGEPVLLRGVNCAGLEWDAGNDRVLPAVLLAADTWNANIIRLPVSQDRWFGYAKEQNDGSGRCSKESYRAVVDEIVRALAARGKYLLLDLHWSDRGVWSEKSGQQLMPDGNSVLFWQDAAARYRDTDNVLFGLYNEPHDVDWNVWLSGGDCPQKDGGFWRAAGMLDLIRTVRETGAENLCVLGGLDWGYTFRGFDRWDALETAGGNLVLDSHVYPWKPLDWDADVGEAAKHFPLLIGECGHYGDDAKPNEGVQKLPAGEWVPRLLCWIGEHRYHLTAWDFHPGAGPCLITGFGGTPTPWYGAYVKEFLTTGECHF